MADEYKEDKTEKATPRQRTKAREQGSVAQSEEVGSVFILLFGLLALYLCSPYMLGRMKELLRHYLAGMGTWSATPGEFPAGVRDAAMTVVTILAPVLGALMAIALVSSYIQFGFVFTTKTLKPKFSALKPSLEKLNPVSKDKLVRLGVGLLKLTVVGFVAYKSVRAEVPALLQIADTSVSTIFGFTAMLIFRVVLKIGVLFIIAAIADFVFKKYKHEESIKMTKQQVKDERKDVEGDPHVKSKIRNIQLRTALQRMMQDVPKADVVITNPIHYAIALKYDKETMWAPKVMAKGARLVAERIKEIARQHGIPCVENKPLTQALYKVCEVGRYIPVAFYHAVAKILAYVYSLRPEKQWV